MTKSNYTAMVITRLGFELENVVLKGSDTTVPMTVNQVEVDPYDNGFGTNEFQNLSFD